MKYNIVSNNSNAVYCEVEAKNEKEALIKYRNSLMSSGFYGFERHNGKWFLNSSYGLFVRADKI